MKEFIRIDKGVPIPPKYSGGVRKYPWKKMAVNDSFLVLCGNARKELKSVYDSLTSCARNAERTTGFRYTFRKVDDGVRVWRTR